MEFDRLGVFTYSDEEDTIAFALHPKIAHRIAESRRRVLMDQQAAISERKNKGLIGRKLPILVEGLSRESDLLMQGRLESQAPEIDGVCLINDSEVENLKSGDFRTIEITQALEHDLLGRIVRQKGTRI
jgi:ribosomal protein S12 methylthiotransferase